MTKDTIAYLLFELLTLHEHTADYRDVYTNVDLKDDTLYLESEGRQFRVKVDEVELVGFAVDADGKCHAGVTEVTL